MATLVFDIETVPQAWDDFDLYTKAQLLKRSKEGSEDEVKHKLGLYPYTGRIVSLAMYDVERRQGATYIVADGTEEIVSKEGFLVKQRTEKEILEDFWEGALSYDVFVTFNGRAFDVPFLLYRSLAHDVRPSVSFSKSRFLTKQSAPYHVDLLDEFTFYGVMNERPSLHLLLRACGIKSEKGVVDGSQVAELFQQKKFSDLIQHNIDDVVATTTLYEKWKLHLAPHSFLNAIEF